MRVVSFEGTAISVPERLPPCQGDLGDNPLREVATRVRMLLSLMRNLNAPVGPAEKVTVDPTWKANHLAQQRAAGKVCERCECEVSYAAIARAKRLGLPPRRLCGYCADHRNHGICPVCSPAQ